MKPITCTLLLTALLLPVRLASAPAAGAGENTPEMVETDGKLSLRFGPERMVLPRGLQPSLLATKSGTLVVQPQVPDKTFPTARMVYFSAMQTVVSRDGGKSWTRIP